MNLALGLLSLIPLWALGHFGQRVFGLRRPGLGGIADDISFGVLTLAISGTLMVLAGRLSVFPVYAILAFFISGVVWRQWRERAGRSSRREGRVVGESYVPARAPESAARKRIGSLTAGAAGFTTLVLVATAVTDRLTWDGWAIWTLRARVLLIEGTLPPIAWQRPGPLAFARPEYPLAVPITDWWMFAHAGQLLPALASAAGAIWFAALVWLLWSELYKRTDSVTAGMAALGLALFRPISEYATGGTADVIVAFALLAAVTQLQSAIFEDGGHRAWIRAAVHLSVAALAKNEGTAVAIATAGAVFFWLVRRHRRPPIAAGAMLLPVAIGVLWQLYVRSVGLGVVQIGGPSSVGEIFANAGMVALAILDLTVYRSWPPVIALILIGYIYALRHNGTLTPGLITTLLYVAMVIGVYLSTPLDLAWLLDTSLSRVVSHLIPAAVFIASVALCGRGVLSVNQLRQSARSGSMTDSVRKPEHPGI